MCVCVCVLCECVCVCVCACECVWGIAVTSLGIKYRKRDHE